MDQFSFDEVPQQKGCRYFVRYGTEVKFNRGFRSRVEMNAWIKKLGRRIDSTAGYWISLRGDSKAIEMVDRENKAVKYKHIASDEI